MTLSRNPTALAGPVEIRLQGGFGVTVAGAPVPEERWPSLRSTHLVQLLALEAGGRLPRERVIEALWPTLDPEAGGANLRKAAHHARQTLGRQDAVVLHGGEVALFPTLPVTVDARAFEEDARAALASGTAEPCAAVARRYAGDVLPAAAYESWAEPVRERLRALQAALLRAACQWEALARFDPTDEPAHRMLMAEALAAGNRAAAIRWYARLRAALLETLAVPPEAETEALYARCLEGLAQRRGTGMVGCDLLRAEAQSVLQLPARERPGGMVVTGAGGIGKTTFCGEVGALARAAGWRVVTVDAGLSGRPYAAVAAAVERLVLEDRAYLDAVGKAAHSTLALLTPLAGPATPLDTPLSRHQVIGAFRRLLVAASGGTALMLQIDDAHQLDDADVDVMLHLATAGPPVFLLLSARPPVAGSALARGLARLVPAGNLRHFELGPMSDADMRALLAQAAPVELGAPVVERILARAAGNPFVALELAHGVQGGSGASGAQAAQATQGVPGLAARLPASVAEALTARLVDLQGPALDLLRWLALVADEFDTAMAIAFAHGDETLASRALDAGLREAVLVVVEARYRFRHELVRQALIDQVAPHRRIRMHREAAQILAKLDVPPALVGRHLLAGGSRSEACDWLLSAAARAIRLAAFSDALHHLEPVLDHQADHAEALRLRAEALDAIGDARAVAAYREAAARAEGGLAHDLLAKGALAQVKQGDPRGALELIRGVVPVTLDGRLAEALTYSGGAALGATDPALGTQKSAEVRRIALETGDRAAIVVASWAQAAAAHARGELHRSVWDDLQDTRQLPDLAVRLFDGQLCILQRFLYGARPYPEVIAFAQGLADEARRIGAARGHAFGTTIHGEAELLAGNLDAAEAHLEEGARLHRAIGGATGESFSLQRLAEVSLYRGRLDEARDRLALALDLARQTDIGFHLLDRIYGTRMRLAADAEAGRWALAEAEDAVHGPLETCPGCRITFAVPAAIAAARAGEVERAEQYEAQTAYLADVVMRLPAWHAAHDEVKGHLARARGEARQAVRDHFLQAARRFGAAGHPLDAQRCEEEAQRAG